MLHHLAHRRSNYDANRVIPNECLNRLTVALFEAPTTRKVEYLRQTVFSKYLEPDPTSSRIRRERAIAKWLLTEERNAETNVRLEHTPWAFNILPGVSFERFVSHVRSIITRVIGEVPSEQIFNGSYSGGASTSRARASSHPAEKYVGRADVTEPCFDWFVDTYQGNLGWYWYSGLNPREGLNLNVVKGNVMFTVPKNSQIDRCACKEPDGNMFMQRGVGDFIRSRLLRRAGQNLNDQTVNKSWACASSIDGKHCTVDLSAASDSVTTGLCEVLLPDLWFSLLMSLRSPLTEIDGVWHVNEMMSSMGNGFTFELESLLFYSIAKAVAYFGGHQGVISVYGDDIIFPTTGYHDLAFVLAYFGFSVNPEKSFYEGSFRESCGGHYDGGQDVTPFYVKGPVRTVLDIIHLANSIRKWSDIGVPHILSSDLSSVWEYCASLVPDMLWGGQNLDDKHALVTGDLPRKRLVPILKERPRHLGHVLMALHRGGEVPYRYDTGRFRPVSSRELPCLDWKGFLSSSN